MKIEDHLKNLKESLEVIDESIEKGIAERQRNIGFNASASSIDMLEIFLHKNSLIDPGFLIKHEWFNSKKKIEEKLSFDFPKKKEIFNHIIKIESERNKLCYGKRQEEEKLEEIVNEFNKLKELFTEVSGYEL